MFTFSEFKARAEDYVLCGDYVKQLRSDDYEIKVNGISVPVYACRISEYPFNRSWPGFQRPYSQTVGASYVNLIGDEALTVEVTAKRSFQKVMIKPYSKGVDYRVSGGKITFRLQENGSFLLALDDYRYCLYLFYTQPIPCESPDSVTYYFGPGIHSVGKITLKDGESVYADKDALVYGCIFAENAKDIRVYGNGVFDDGTEERVIDACYCKNRTNGNMKFFDCENVKVEGVLFKDSAIWCVNIFHCRNVTLDNIKVFGQWRYNTDGVDLVNSRDIVLRNSFIHSFDDTVTVKGIEAFEETNNQNILVENCVLLCDWGRACEIGLETNCRLYDNIVFRNCDVLRGGYAAMDIQNGDCAEVRNIRFENIRVEYERFHRPEVQQRTEDQVYDRENDTIFGYLFNVTNSRSPCNWIKPAERDLTAPAAQVHDISLKDITVYYDETIPLKEGKRQVPIHIDSVLKNIRHDRITVENVRVNGERLSEENALLELSGVDGFILK